MHLFTDEMVEAFLKTYENWQYLSEEGEHRITADDIYMYIVINARKKFPFSSDIIDSHVFNDRGIVTIVDNMKFGYQHDGLNWGISTDYILIGPKFRREIDWYEYNLVRMTKCAAKANLILRKQKAEGKLQPKTIHCS